MNGAVVTIPPVAVGICNQSGTDVSPVPLERPILPVMSQGPSRAPASSSTVKSPMWYKSIRVSTTN